MEEFYFSIIKGSDLGVYKYYTKKNVLYNIFWARIIDPEKSRKLKEIIEMNKND